MCIRDRINEDNFSDANFREFVTRYDTNKDGILQRSELDVVHEMKCHSREITDIDGVQFFTSLKLLDCLSLIHI